MTRNAAARRRKEALQGWMLLLPALAIMLVFTVYPVFRSLYLSLFKYRMGKVPEWIGLGNYEQLFSNSTFWKVMRNTVVFALMTVLPSMALGLMLALLVNRRGRHIGFIRSSFFYPSVMPMIAIASVWMFIYMARNGLFDQLLISLGLEPMNVLSNKDTVLPAMAVMYDWKEAGYLMIFFLGCLPWSWTLPAALVKYIKARKLPELDKTSGFLLTWALVINIFYQCMATKYTTYTLPGLLPIAVLIARYLYEREVFVKRTVAVMLAVFAILTFTVAAPVCSQDGHSGKVVAGVYKDRVQTDDLVVSYGDYKTSNVFYGDHMVYRLEHKEDIAGMLPDGKSWNAKNVMPFMALEELPTERDVYLILNNRKFDLFEKDFNTAEWELLDSFKSARVYYRKAK